MTRSNDDEADPELLAKLEMGTEAPPPRWPWLVGGGVVVLALVSLARCPGGGQDLELVAVERGDLTLHVEAVGSLEPLHEVDIGPELSGIVAEVLVDENDLVSAGDVLATLDARLLEAQADQADAEVAAARASLRHAQLQEEAGRLERSRAEQVGEGGGVAAAELDRVRLSHEAQVASVQVAQAQLQRALAAQRVAYTNLEKAVLRSPTDGVVLERNVDAGQAVVTSLQTPILFRVAEGLEQMSLVVEIDEADIPRVHAGQRATFTVAAWAEQPFEATVHSVRLAPMPGVDVVTYEAELHVDNTEGLLRPGMSASARLMLSEPLEDVLLVPNAALRFDPPGRTPPDGPHVWVSRGGGVEAVSVEPGATDGTRTVIRAEGRLDGAQVAVGEAK